MAFIQLPNSVFEGLISPASFPAVQLVVTVPPTARPWGRLVLRHTGTTGFWFGRFAGGTPSATVYDFILGFSEPFQLDNPPLGDIKVTPSGPAIGNLSWSLSYKV